jgi:predicted transcriptional regulator
MIGKINNVRGERMIHRSVPRVKESEVAKSGHLKKLEKDYVKAVTRLRELYRETSNPSTMDAKALFEVCMEFHKVSTLYQLMEAEHAILQQEDEQDF